MAKINKSVNPCDNFYEFACGGYRDVGSPLHEMQNEINDWIEKLAMEPVTDKDDKLVKLMKIFYQSCKNNVGSLNDFIEDGIDLRRRIDPSAEHKHDFTWEEVIHDLQFYQNSDAYLFSIRMEYFDDHVRLVVDQPTFETKAGFLDRNSCTTCLCKMKDKLDIAVAAVYARHAVDETVKMEIADIINATKSQLFDTFEAQDWLDSKTKEAAKKKLSAMKFYVGYPDMLLDENFLSTYYKDLDTTERSLVEIYRQIHIHKCEVERKLLGDVSDLIKDLLFLKQTAGSIPQVNALYTPYFNTFLICAGFIQSQLFSIDRPKSMNYGILGAVVGHEIMHGYDNEGRKYDENGQRRNWWVKEDEIKFIEKSKCFVDQYGRYVEPKTGLNVNGQLTLGENIADNGGTLLAYKTYQKEHKIDTILPNVEFTPNQLFWISKAHSYCSNYDYKYMETLIKSDSHAPGRFRVIGTLGNLKEFGDDFQCPVGSGMNRQNKCKIW
ncbi:neprilysin-2-like [Chironomus tepperi]|uniref:neprilysin-2-like n=1 Tax=Chironomus tepperi TaxID=113505 RepID=UPI00391F874F